MNDCCSFYNTNLIALYKFDFPIPFTPNIKLIFGDNISITSNSKVLKFKISIFYNIINYLIKINCRIIFRININLICSLKLIIVLESNYVIISKI